MNMNVLFAVFKRNFTAYFYSPLGYLFICVFVWMGSAAAFWPYDFFNTNLANLDQLNKVFPFIMLFFVPAITMSLWSDERRQGTDELLLTIPASDFDIVLGKYLAALAIYSVSLFFSLVCNFMVLRWLGNPDVGLLLGTYVGYLLIGVAMLAVGMVASFLTGNLTVSFVLAALFNVPLALASMADVVLPAERARDVQQWSAGDHLLRSFGRGILSFSGLVYFLAIAAAMLYLAMVLIGRRHWVRGRDGGFQAAHFALRVACLVAVAFGLTYFFRHHDVRLDVTSERLSSLAPETTALLDKFEPGRPVQIEAFISPTVPEGYVQTRLNLISRLQEMEARGRGHIVLRINSTEPNSEDAMWAEKRYGITPRGVRWSKGGAYTEEPIFMGVAFTSGLQKVILPFIDRGIPIEYELIRSAMTVTQQKRKKVGVLQTDAQLYGSFNMQTMGRSSNWPIIDELQKAYEVVQVDAAAPITEKYDVLLAVQPSTLGPEQMNNFLAYVKAGNPTAIFEDPLPYFTGGSVPGTSEPRRPPGGMNPMMGMGGGAQPKGEIRELWRTLGVDFSADNIVYQDYNPFPKLADLNQRYPEFVFVTRAAAREPFNPEDPATSGLQHVFFPFPGSISKLNSSSLEFTPLVRTGTKTGTVRFRDLYEMPPMFGRGDVNPNARKHPQGVEYVMAARIRGKLPASQPMADPAADAKPADAAKPAEPAAEPKKDAEVNVVLVSDVDLMHGLIFRIREQGDIPEQGLYFDFDNVTFVLNVLDELAGDEQSQQFIAIRSRRPVHRTLTRIDQVTEAKRKETGEEIAKLQEQLEKARDDEQKKLDDRIKELEKEWQKQNINTTAIMERVAIEKTAGQKRLETTIEQEQVKLKKRIDQIRTEQEILTRAVQNRYKMFAVLLPPIPWLLVAVGVFIARKLQEREGVSRSRLRS